MKSKLIAVVAAGGWHHGWAGRRFGGGYGGWGGYGYGPAFAGLGLLGLGIGLGLGDYGLGYCSPYHDPYNSCYAYSW
jgi:hypothetical protein